MPAMKTKLAAEATYSGFDRQIKNHIIVLELNDELI